MPLRQDDSIMLHGMLLVLLPSCRQLLGCVTCKAGWWLQFLTAVVVDVRLKLLLSEALDGVCGCTVQLQQHKGVQSSILSLLAAERPPLPV